MLGEKTIALVRKETGEPEDITKKRQTSLQEFSKIDLPSLKTESWRYTSLKDISLEKFENLITEEILFSVKKGKDVIACTMKDAFAKHKELLMKYLPGSLIDFDKDKFSAMHYSFWNTGFFIFVPKKTEADVSITINSEKEGAVLSHNLIVVEEESSLAYFEEQVSGKGDYICLKNDMTYLMIKDNSNVSFHNFQNWKENVISISNWRADLAKDSSVSWIFGQFGGKLSRVKIDTMFNGQGSSSKTNGVFYGDSSQHFDITTDAYHNVPNTNCDILVKGALDDSSSSVYRGKIKILKVAQQTNSYLSDHSMMLSENSISNSIPSLEIDANDVKASHGATIGKPDDEELFYLMARGLSRKEAQRLIITGYFSPVIELIKNSDFKEKLQYAIEGKKK